MRVQLLSKLAESETDSARSTIDKEIDAAAAVLESATDYAQLEMNISILKTIGFRRSAIAVEALARFVGSVEQRRLSFSESSDMVAALEEYRTNESLLKQAADGLAVFRYQETAPVLNTFFKLSTHPSEAVRKTALRGLQQLSGYDISVFYGTDKRRGIGAAPQMIVLEELERSADAVLLEHLSAVLTVLQSILSPEMEGSAWSHDSVTISRSDTPPAAGIPEVRRRALRLLTGIYHLVDTRSQRLGVIGTMTSATRSGRAKGGDDSRDMFVENSQAVLTFFLQLVRSEHPQILQRIEHDSFWIYFHAADEPIRQAARRVETALSQNPDYRIYRDLVGFEGIFGDWAELANRDHDREPPGIDETRKARSRDYANSINEANYQDWRERILRYAETESDDLAAFPVFYYFLETFASVRPEEAFRLLSNDTEHMARFLIPLLRGLWTGRKRQEVTDLITKWISEGRHLYASAKQFLANQHVDLSLLNTLLKRAGELKDMRTIHQIVSVAVSNFGSMHPTILDDLMLPAIHTLTANSDADWIFDVWFRDETRRALLALHDAGIALVLNNLKTLARIDYHAERILQAIAEKQPEAVYRFFLERVYRKHSKGEESDPRFEPLPFELNKVKELLSQIPGFAVRVTREAYEGDYGMFVYRGARLLKIVFSDFPKDFEAELLQLVQQGGDDNLDFVLAVLRNFEGTPSTHSLAREIVKASSTDDRFRSKLAIALESTGVVHGEFGVSNAYERKREEVADWLEDHDERVREFAKWYVASLERTRDAERRRAEEDIELRKFRYRDLPK